jgi:hypothetical protein
LFLKPLVDTYNLISQNNSFIEEGLNAVKFSEELEEAVEKKTAAGIGYSLSRQCGSLSR